MSSQTEILLRHRDTAAQMCRCSGESAPALRDVLCFVEKPVKLSIVVRSRPRRRGSSKQRFVRDGGGDVRNSVVADQFSHPYASSRRQSSSSDDATAGKVHYLEGPHGHDPLHQRFDGRPGKSKHGCSYSQRASAFVLQQQRRREPAASSMSSSLCEMAAPPRTAAAAVEEGEPDEMRRALGSLRRRGSRAAASPMRSCSEASGASAVPSELESPATVLQSRTRATSGKFAPSEASSSAAVLPGISTPPPPLSRLHDSSRVRHLLRRLEVEVQRFCAAARTTSSDKDAAISDDSADGTSRDTLDETAVYQRLFTSALAESAMWERRAMTLKAAWAASRHREAHLARKLRYMRHIVENLTSCVERVEQAAARRRSVHVAPVTDSKDLSQHSSAQARARKVSRAEPSSRLSSSSHVVHRDRQCDLQRFPFGHARDEACTSDGDAMPLYTDLKHAAHDVDGTSAEDGLVHAKALADGGDIAWEDTARGSFEIPYVDGGAEGRPHMACAWGADGDGVSPVPRRRHVKKFKGAAAVSSSPNRTQHAGGGAEPSLGDFPGPQRRRPPVASAPMRGRYATISHRPCTPKGVTSASMTTREPPPFSSPRWLPHTGCGEAEGALEGDDAASTTSEAGKAAADSLLLLLRRGRHLSVKAVEGLMTAAPSTTPSLTSMGSLETISEGEAAALISVHHTHDGATPLTTQQHENVDWEATVMGTSPDAKERNGERRPSHGPLPTMTTPSTSPGATGSGEALSLPFSRPTSLHRRRDPQQSPGTPSASLLPLSASRSGRLHAPLLEQPPSSPHSVSEALHTQCCKAEGSVPAKSMATGTPSHGTSRSTSSTHTWGSSSSPSPAVRGGHIDIPRHVLHHSIDGQHGGVPGTLPGRTGFVCDVAEVTAAPTRSSIDVWELMESSVHSGEVQTQNRTLRATGPSSSSSLSPVIDKGGGGGGGGVGGRPLRNSEEHAPRWESHSEEGGAAYVRWCAQLEERLNAEWALRR